MLMLFGVFIVVVCCLLMFAVADPADVVVLVVVCLACVGVVLERLGVWRRFL